MIGKALLIASCALAVPSQDEEPHSPSASEGPLDNAAFLPVDERATTAIAAADAKLAAEGLLSRAVDASHERAWIEVFDQWHAALRDSSTGEMVAPQPRDRASTAPSPWPDADGTSDAQLDRRRDGIEAAVLRRLAIVSAPARALWRSRFEPLAEQRLARAPGDVAELATLERIFPATASAARAALQLSDFELERARPDAASTWLERARAHLARLDGSSAALEKALAVRERAIASELAALVPSGADEVWRTARRVAPVAETLIDESAVHYARAAFEPGLGLRAGMCFLDGGLAAVQLPPAHLGGGLDQERLVLVELTTATRLAICSPEKLLEPFGAQLADWQRPIEPPGWPLLPASDGRAIVTTVGRCDAGMGLSNALVCVEFDRNAASAQTPTLDLHWAWLGGTRIAGPEPREDAGWQGAALEFEPGPIVRGGEVFALVREFLAPPKNDSLSPSDSGGEIRSWVVALELASGALRWKTELGKGTEIQRNRMRFFGAALPPASAQPLAWAGTHLFAATSTGYATLLDAADGRVDWGFRCRRREAERRSWTGGRPPVDEDGTSIVWGSPDSDHLYWLRAGPDLDGTGILQRAPWRVGEGQILIGGDANEALVLSRDGADRRASVWIGASGRSYDAARLGPAETFAGEGRCSPTRAWFASTRNLYLLDRTRELFVLDAAPLKALRAKDGAAGLPGGSVFVRGGTVCVLGATSLWVYEAGR